MLETAYLLSKFKFNCELRFIAFGGEEVGLLGSQHYAKKAAESGENIVATFNVDMVGFNWINDQTDIVTNRRSSWIVEFIRIINKF